MKGLMAYRHFSTLRAHARHLVAVVTSLPKFQRKLRVVRALKERGGWESSSFSYKVGLTVRKFRIIVAAVAVVCVATFG